MREPENIIMDEERNHLLEVQMIIEKQLLKLNVSLDSIKNQILEQKRYLWDNFYDFDPQEIVFNRINISEQHDNYKFQQEQAKLLLRLLDNTYFGRIDFVNAENNDEEVIYIGLGGLKDMVDKSPIIYDWRAPIASMYYDFDIGSAFYNAPNEKIEGELIRKRQFKVRKGSLEFVIDSDIRITDDILQKELALNSTSKMKNIVATIQREQNSIIRDSLSQVLVVQGVAGSGKTSIALHRVAYLLYQNRGKLCASDILIISPNKIFADYISNVLPELGEENIVEVSLDEIAINEMMGEINCETKLSQMDYLANNKSDLKKRMDRIRLKGSLNFLYEMREFVKNLENGKVQFRTFEIGNNTIQKEQLERWYNVIYSKDPLYTRLDKISDRIIDICENVSRLTSEQCKKIKQTVFSMATQTDILDIYSDFLESLKSKYLELDGDYINKDKLLYEDVYPIILLKLLLYGKNSNQFQRIKHIIIDEMQDYSMIQFEILNKLFDCRMTILGDTNQLFDKQDDSYWNSGLQEIFDKSFNFIKLTKSYRSTFEINEVSRKIGKINDVISFERHGELPEMIKCDDYFSMVKRIQSKLEKIEGSDITTTAIICKSTKEAELLYESLSQQTKKEIHLLSNPDMSFATGIIVTSSFLAKGLEFDYVLIPEVTEALYCTEIDRHILYIACSRALHKLDFLYYGNASCFLEEII